MYMFFYKLIDQQVVKSELVCMMSLNVHYTFCSLI